MYHNSTYRRDSSCHKRPKYLAIDTSSSILSSSTTLAEIATRSKGLLVCCLCSDSLLFVAVVEKTGDVPLALVLVSHNCNGMGWLYFDWNCDERRTDWERARAG